MRRRSRVVSLPESTRLPATRALQDVRRRSAPAVLTTSRGAALGYRAGSPALRELEHTGSPVTFQTVAGAAGVSRSWLYTQPDLKAEIQRLREAARESPISTVPVSQKATDISLLRRLEAATQRNRELAAENQQLRRRLARALGDERAARGTDQAASRRHASATIGPC